MGKKTVILAAVIFILFPYSAFAICISGTGFGTAGANGTYLDQGYTTAGQPTYKNQNNFYLFQCTSAGTAKLIDTTLSSCADTTYYYASTFTGGTWNVDGLGSSPGGTTSEIACSDSGAGTSTATTTEEISYHDWILVNGIIVFLLMFVPISMLFSIFKTKR